MVLSIDEKSQIQALDRTQPGLPIKPGRCQTMTHDYKRRDTTTLFATLSVLDEFYRVAFRKKIYRTVDELQADLDAWIVEYNQRRSHQGRWCFGKTPMQTFLDALPLAKEKLMAA